MRRRSGDRMNAALKPPIPQQMTAEAFLAWPGDDSGWKYQLVDGDVSAVPPASRTHGQIQFNAGSLLDQAARAAGLKLGMIVEGAVVPRLGASTNVRVPDLAVTAAPDEAGQIAIPEPILLIEILSPGNIAATRDNLRSYATLPSVQEIVIIHSARPLAEVFRRGPEGSWPPGPELVGAEGTARSQHRATGLPADGGVPRDMAIAGR